MRCGDASDLLGMQTTEPEGPPPVLLFWPDVRPDAIRTLYIEPGDRVLDVVRVLCASHDRCQHLVVIVSNPHHDLGNVRSAVLLGWLAGLHPFLCLSLSCVFVGRPWLRQCASSLGLVTFPSLGDCFRALWMLVHQGQEPLFDEEASEERRRDTDGS